MRFFGAGQHAVGRMVVLLSAGATALTAGVWHETRSLDTELRRLRTEVATSGVERVRLSQALDAERLRAAGRDAVVLGQVMDLRQGGGAGPATAGVEDLRSELERAKLRLAALESDRTVGENVIRSYGGGVCLIQGAYVLEPPAGGAEEQAPGGAAKPGPGLAAARGARPRAVQKVEYYGTGFLVDRSGLVLTNRHIAEPWWSDDEAEAQIARGYTPRFITLRAFFPQSAEPVDVTPRAVSETADLAVLHADLRGRKVPVLPLADDDASAVAGHPVVVIGYPTGLEAIMAKAETGVVRTILDAHGSDRDRVTEALSRRGLIRPSATQGHIGDVTRTDIVFDAPTTQGGSGGPIFNREGRVVAVEYAVLPQFGGNSFAVPIGFARDLLRALRGEARRAD